MSKKRKKSRKQKQRKMDFEIEASTKKGIILVLIFALSFVSFLSIFDLAGAFGQFLYKLLKLAFGGGFWMVPFVLAMIGYLLLENTRHFFRAKNWIGLFFIIISFTGFLHLLLNPEFMSEALSLGRGGGYVGYGLAWPLYKIMGKIASIGVVIALFFVGVLMAFETSLENLIDILTVKKAREWAREKIRKEEKDEDYEVHGEYEENDQDEEYQEDEGVDFYEKEVSETKDVEDEDKKGEQLSLVEKEDNEGKSEKKEKRIYPKIDIPIDLLNAKSGKPTAKDIDSSQRTIKKTLKNFGIEVEMGDISIGPTVTQYTFRPADGVKLSRIVGLGNDMALALAAHPIRIEAPIPGKSLVGIEVPNQKIAIVTLREVLTSDKFKNAGSHLNIVLGKDVAGDPWVADLTKLPHLLVAGATNSGKTVCLNTIIISLLYQNQPDELKLILVDPKRVEMTGYNNIPHLITPVITDVKKTVNALKWTIGEMDRRFQVLSNAGKRNIQSYNASHKDEKLPYLVFVIDELADLMSTASAEVEASIIRLAQMARAVGIHLILATQRPSVDVITGLIKANIPGRIAFSVASLTDSRTILDTAGAEKLLGRGDMLYSSAEISKPKRIQGAYCSDGDIENVVAYLKDKGLPDYEEGVTERKSSGLGGIVIGGSDSDEDEDELLPDARDLIVNERKASASFLQRRLKVGYARAARLLDILEEKGIVGPSQGAKPREILVKKGEDSLVEQADNIIESQESMESGHDEVSSEEEVDLSKEEDSDDFEDGDKEDDSDFVNEDNESDIEDDLLDDSDDSLENEIDNEEGDEDSEDVETENLNDEEVEEDEEDEEEDEEDEEDKYSF